MKRSLLILSVAVAFVYGCGSTKEAETAIKQDSDVSAKTKLVFIPKSAGNPYFAQIEVGLKGSADANSIEYSTQAPQSADATSQVSVIKDQVQRGENAIVLSANSPDALNEALDQAKAKGVAVITVDSDLTGNESHRAVGIIPVDFSKIGSSQIELLGSMIGYEGEFAILSATTDAPNQNAWIAGMKEALKNAKYAKMKLVEVVYGDDEPQKSTTETEALLTKHANLKGILAPTSVGLAAAANVISQKKVFPGAPNAKNGGVVLTGLGTPNELKKAIETGAVQKFQLWDPADMGIVASYLARSLHEKKLEIKPGATFEVPGKGKFEVMGKNIVVAGELVTFDKTNIGKYNF